MFRAYVKNPHRFAKRSELVRYSRLGVTKYDSGGKTLKHEHLDRAGCGALKYISRKEFMGSMRTCADNRFKRAYKQSLENTGDPDHARLSVQRKILATMWAMWRDGTRYGDSQIAYKRA